MLMPPMLLETAPDPFDSPDYIFEPKIDGHRLTAIRANGETRLFTRHRHEVTRQYPELWDIPVRGDAVLDGEVACVDPQTGAICFESVMERFRIKKADRVRSAAARMPVHFVVFDIVWHSGKDLRRYSLLDRKAILDEVLPDSPHISKITFVQERGEELFGLIRQKSMEGIVAKRIGSTYVGGRSSDWLKIINWQHADVFITGYRKNEFGWLVAADTEGGLKPAGIIELGVSPTHKQAFFGVANGMKSDENEEYVFVEPRIRARVKMRNWTRSGLLRSPVFEEFIV